MSDMTRDAAERMPDIGERINRTPRTDANARDGWSGDAACVSVEFAGQLEDELALATTAMAEKDAEIERLRSIIGEAIARFRTDGQPTFANYLEKKASQQ
jgi:hypothetical protein